MKTKNVKLLIKRLESLLDSPEAAQFNMRYFGNQWVPNMMNVSTELRTHPPICRTQACLAGETVLAMGTGQIMSDGGIRVGNGETGWGIEHQAAKDLGLIQRQRSRLFFFEGMTSNGEGWPKKFEDAYKAAKTPQGRLYVAIRRVEHFLVTKGRE